MYGRNLERFRRQRNSLCWEFMGWHDWRATFTAKYPDRIGVSILMNCTASSASIRHKFEYPLLIQMGFMLGGLNRWPLQSNVTKAFLGPTSINERPEKVHFVHETLATVDTRSVAWAVSSVVPQRPDQHKLISQIKTPVLVIAGSEDAVFSTSETKAMADSIPGAEFVILQCTAHLAGLETPEQVNNLIESMLNKHKGCE